MPMSQFKSSLNFSNEKVKSILFKKINEEKRNIEGKKTAENIQRDNQIIKRANQLYDNSKVNIVSLFSGAGGLDLGVILAGISVSLSEKEMYSHFNDRKWLVNNMKYTNIIYSNDLFQSSNATYSDNFSGDFVKDDRDIRDVLSFPKSDLMLGGFPCPGFSVAGPRLLDDPRNFLYIHYIRALLDSQPKFFIAENVKGLMTMAKGKVLQQIREDFTAAGYHVDINLVNAKNYGVSQSRERVFIIGIRNDLYSHGTKYVLPEITNSEFDKSKKPLVTLKEAISDLPKFPNDYYTGSYSSMYLSRNRKKNWNDVSFTIQASARQVPQYPGGLPMEKIDKDHWKFQGEINRRLSVRECARIQSFPDWFEFSDSGKDNVSRANRLNEKYKQIGNAVPVILAEKITRPVLSNLITELASNKTR